MIGLKYFYVSFVGIYQDEGCAFENINICTTHSFFPIAESTDIIKKSHPHFAGVRVLSWAEISKDQADECRYYKPMNDGPKTMCVNKRMN